MSRNVEIQDEVNSDPSQANFRLEDVITSEVSLVDQAANGRKFLIIKRKGDMNKKDATILKGKEEEVKEVVTKVEVPEISVEELVTKVKEKIKINKALKEDSKFMLEMMVGAMQSMCMNMNAIQSDLMAFILSDGNSTFGGQMVTKSLTNVAQEVISDETMVELVALVEKKGKKMKGERMAKLKEILGGLTTLVKELETDSGNTEVNKGGATMTEKTEVAKSETAVVQTETKTEAPKTEAKVETPAASASVEEITKAVSAKVSEEVAKALKPLQDEIEKLKAAPVAPKSDEAAETEEITKAAGEKKSIFKGLL